MSKKPSERELPIEPGCLAQIVRAKLNPENLSRVVRVLRLWREGDKCPDGWPTGNGGETGPIWWVESLGAPLVSRISSTGRTMPARQVHVVERSLRRLPEIDPGEVEALYAAPVTPERARTLATELRDADFF